MSDKSFTEYRKKITFDDEDNNSATDEIAMETDEKPKIERKWYKHVYKSSLRKIQSRDDGQSQNHGGGHTKRSNLKRFSSDLEDRKPLFDLRSRTIDRNRRDSQLQKDYVANLSKLYFPKSSVQKTFVIAVDEDERRAVQMQVKSSK